MAPRPPTQFFTVAHDSPDGYGAAGGRANDQRTLLSRLLEASREADSAELNLEKARVAYEDEHSSENLRLLRDVSRATLAREVEFDRLWRDALSRGFGYPTSE